MYEFYMETSYAIGRLVIGFFVLWGFFALIGPPLDAIRDKWRERQRTKVADTKPTDHIKPWFIQ